MATSIETATIMGFAALLTAVATLGWNVWKARKDDGMLKEGIGALYRVVESNKAVVESLLTQVGKTSQFEAERVALRKSQIEMERLKTWGKALKWMFENSD